jgi:catechol 2,3-dioxygenase-like lactoylglutathione lyase family enzyme
MRPFSRITSARIYVVFKRVTIRVSDLDASRRFYALAEAPEEVVLEAAEEPTRHLHIAFAVSSPAEVDAWWRRLVDAGYPGDGEPGPRPEYSDMYYGAFVLDPDGNSVEAVHHAQSSRGVDHLWIRTRDVAAERAKYVDAKGIRLVRDDPGLVRFRDDDGSFTFVDDDRPPTQHASFEKR